MTDEQSTTSDLVAFQFEAQDVRIHLDSQQRPWWEAQDVCAILGLKDVSQAIARLHLGEKRTLETRNVLIINESGLYRLIFRSNKPQAERFQNWVFQEVLPTIRQTGTYQAPPLTEGPVDRYPQLRAIRELITATATAQWTAERAEEKAHAAEVRAVRAETKADLALEDARYLAVEEFVMKNGLIHQYPDTCWHSMSNWLKHFCEDYGLEIRKTSVYGKKWNDENTYPWQAFSAFLRYDRKRPHQISLVKDPSV